MKEIQVQAPVSEQAKQAYGQPQLTKHGRVEQLTQLIQIGNPSCPYSYNEVK